VWDLSNTTVQTLFPKELKDGLSAYEKVAKWMFAAYTLAFWITLAEIVLGIFAIFSRWGSFVTTIASTVSLLPVISTNPKNTNTAYQASSIFIIAAAITSTALYGALAGSFDTSLKEYGIKGSVGTKMLAVVWLAVAFSLGAGLFWLFSTCCCSGKSNKSKKMVVEKTPYTYERVASPYLGARDGHEDTLPLNPVPHGGPSQNSAYEPFRQTQV
jgi:SUR7/PalI family